MIGAYATDRERFMDRQMRFMQRSQAVLIPRSAYMNGHKPEWLEDSASVWREWRGFGDRFERADKLDWWQHPYAAYYLIGSHPRAVELRAAA